MLLVLKRACSTARAVLPCVPLRVARDALPRLLACKPDLVPPRMEATALVMQLL